MPGTQRRVLLPYAQWPVIDKRLWECAMSSNDPFGNTAGRQLAKATQQNYLLAWRHFLRLLATVEPMALDAPPSERLTIERVRALVHHLAETNTPRSVAAQIGRLYEVARLMMPDLDWSWLKFVKARLRTAAPALLRKGPVITSVQLLGVGQQLMDESHPSLSNPISLADAVRYRDGLMIALLAFVPLRRKNITAIEIGRHLVQEGDRWFIIIPREETKTGTSIEFAVPELLVPYLATYLSIVRPRILQGPSCKALWINREGGALSPGAVSAVVIRRTARRLGIRISPHDVRDAAATTWAVAAPGQIGIARDLLSHSDLRTTTRYYNRARGIEASRAYAQLVAERRRRRTFTTNHNQQDQGSSPCAARTKL
jgi:integrase/recombinase XerD